MTNNTWAYNIPGESRFHYFSMEIQCIVVTPGAGYMERRKLYEQRTAQLYRP